MSEGESPIRVKKYMCSILDEMRKLDKIKNYAPMESLIEHLQIVGNRMEAGLQSSKSAGYDLDKILKDNKLSDKKKLEKIRKVIDSRWDFSADRYDDDLSW